MARIREQPLLLLLAVRILVWSPGPRVGESNKGNSLGWGMGKAPDKAVSKVSQGHHMPQHLCKTVVQQGGFKLKLAVGSQETDRDRGRRVGLRNRQAVRRPGGA